MLKIKGAIVPGLYIFEYRDMYSGGSKKTGYDNIFVYAKDEREADELFEEELGLDPNESEWVPVNPNEFKLILMDPSVFQ